MVTLRVSGECDTAAMKRRFARACEAARVQYGNDPYSGTLAVKSPLDVVVVPGVCADEDGAYDVAEARIDKWGPTLALRVQKAKEPGVYWMLFALCAS